MSAEQLNAFLRRVGELRSLRRQMSACDPFQAAALAHELGFEVTVGDLVRYKARATTWQLSDAELEVVVSWQPSHQRYWWQCVWPEDVTDGA